MEYGYKKLSCGILIVDKNNNLLMMRAEGNEHWDIPKGTQEPAESPLDTALRETKEETGLDLSAAKLINLSWFPYNSRKDLHLFLHCVDSVDVQSLKCNSYFMRDGFEVSEAEEYKMIPLDQAYYSMCKSMQRLYSSELQKLIERKMSNLA